MPLELAWRSSPVASSHFSKPHLWPVCPTWPDSSPLPLPIPLLPSPSPLPTASFRLSLRSFRDRLAAASCAQISLPDLQLQSLTRTWTNTLWLQLLGALPLAGAARAAGAAEGPDRRPLYFRLRWIGVFIPADGHNCEVVHSVWCWCRTKQTVVGTLFLMAVGVEKESATLSHSLPVWFGVGGYGTRQGMLRECRGLLECLSWHVY